MIQTQPKPSHPNLLIGAGAYRFEIGHGHSAGLRRRLPQQFLGARLAPLVLGRPVLLETARAVHLAQSASRRVLWRALQRLLR